METFVNWVLCILGMGVFFLGKFNGRTDKTKEPSLGFWWKDNWPELVNSLLITCALMIILSLASTELNFDAILAKLPFHLGLAPKPIAAFILGAGGSAFAYKIVNKKAKAIMDKVVDETGQAG
jgi:hypothetical protein